MRENIIGLNPGSDIISAARCRIDQQGRFRIEKAVWDEPSAAVDAKTASTVIRRLWRRQNPGSFSVVTCLRSQAMIVKFFNYSGIQEDELPGVLQLDAEEALQCDPGEVYFDWYLSQSGSNNESGSSFSGTLVAAPRRDVDQLFMTISNASLYPVGCSISPMAVANLFSATRASSADTSALDAVCLVRAGSQNSDIVVLYGEKGIYPHTVFMHPSQSANPAKYLSECVNDVLSYYRFKLHLPDISRIYLAGMVDEDLHRQLAETASVPIDTWNPFEIAHGVNRKLQQQLNEASPAVRSSLIVSLGLSLS